MNRPQQLSSGAPESGESQLPVPGMGNAWRKGLGAAALICALLTGCGSGGDEPVKAKPTPTVTVTATVTATPEVMTSQVSSTLADATGVAEKHGYDVSAHDASDKDASPGDDWTVCFEKYTYDSVEFAAVTSNAPCPKADGRPIPWPAMPTAVGGTYAHAVKTVAKATTGDITVKASYKDEDVDDSQTSEGDYDDWKVCFQTPAPGTRLVGDRDVTLWLTESHCPAAKGTYKDRTNDPNYTPPSHSSGSGSSSSASSASGGSSSSTGGATTCEIRSNAGNCYNAGQFCRGSDVGSSTHAANGRLIYCRDEGSWNRWNY
ncbi:hypothetical protein [Streptomyces sp. NPDC059575]|uniref:hypothetical protein n=1 Tax=Streptomyces sp. NPDC059575 TaxID=3346872 RepID=UPI00368214B6